ncbi:MAG: nucleotidyl transferase AbiEii/AbiGii toxin family protein [Oscillospiraceae bacterium]|nr:nucleotidyl transferase AbiEii/AbiGii toxin family protein [Oscillospiraceae bacterium]
MITAEEKLMYQVMKAIYESGIPIDFKGSMVLKACLIEAGYDEEIRHTVDIDANWYSADPLTADQMVASLQKVLDRNKIALRVSIYRMYDEKRSAGFELADNSSGEILFTMDIDVNRPTTSTKVYEIDSFHFRGVTPNQMIADKVSAISSDRVFYRIKDVIDLYYLSKAFDFNCFEILKTLEDSSRVLGTFNGFLNRQEDLKHAYDKFRLAGDVNKPQFSEVYSSVRDYIKDILPKN